MREITRVIVHCSATPKDMDIGVKEIRKWHTDQAPEGRGWADIGYHYVIRRSGTVETGRPLHIKGAHTLHHNDDSIGICLVGGTDSNDRNKAEANFNLSQYKALDNLIESLQHEFGQLKIFGHRDFTNKKACPCFDVKALLER